MPSACNVTYLRHLLIFFSTDITSLTGLGELRMRIFFYFLRLIYFLCYRYYVPDGTWLPRMRIFFYFLCLIYFLFYQYYVPDGTWRIAHENLFLFSLSNLFSFLPILRP